MPPFGPVKRQDLIRALKKLGFKGPYSGSRHQFMIKGDLKLYIPNPHGGEISKGLLAKILKQGNIAKIEWENV